MATMKPLVTDLASTLNYVPSNFIRPIGDRPDLQLLSSTNDSIPIIDLQGLDSSNRSEIIQKNCSCLSKLWIFSNCESWDSRGGAR
ncbi:unnamed protein product [Lathyrus oleraceus]